MEKRQNLVNKFSSFLSLRDDSHQLRLIWQIDPELEKKMKLKVEADPNAKEKFWAQYFIRVLLVQYQSNQNLLQLNPECSLPIVKRHLSAYLQESCLKAAKEIHRELKYIKHKYSVEEYFQIANIAASSPGKLFKSFNFARDKINIEAYAIAAFKRFVRNQIYQQDLEARRTRFSNYGLLRNLSVAEFNESLVAQNFQNNQIILYRLAWQCFNEISELTPNRLSNIKKPSNADFTAIASYYNQRCERLNFPHISANYITIETMLSSCIHAARNYRAKQYLAFEENYNIIPDAPSILDVLIQQEEWHQVQVIVKKLFTNMPELCKIIFQLWQGLNLTQTEVANILKDKYPELQKQYQVARKLKRCSRSILKKFAEEWNQINSEVYVNDDRDIKRIKSALEQCLKLYCREIYFSFLDKNIKVFTDEEKNNILNNNNSVNRLSNQQTNYDLEPESDFVAAIKLKLVKLFQCQLENNMCLPTNSLSRVNDRIVDFVNEWIESK
ncbi:MAG: sigma-70 family RNA polymerase sigma factor [Rivularia sp. (in: cyanobacteria)]